jgi:CRISPR-associated protein Cas2
MRLIVCYDVDTTTKEGERRLRKIAQVCLDHGVRVQYSVFECDIDGAAWVRMRDRLLGELDVGCDSLRIYFLDARAAERTEHYGVRLPVDGRRPLIV